MKDKTILITGGNTGIGKATAIGLAKKGATIIIACRNTSKAEIAVEAIQKASKNNAISYIKCDLADFSSIAEAARNFQKQHARLDVLINNAGCIMADFVKTKDGLETQIGVNHFGHFLLTNLLLPQLQAATAARVVNVSSIAHRHASINFDSFHKDTGSYHMMKVYGQSKLANVLFTKEFAKRYPTITCNCLHPGVVASEIGAKPNSFWLRWGWYISKSFMVSTEKGARTSIWLASSDKVANVTGKYFSPKLKEGNISPLAEDQALRTKLWEISKNIVATYVAKA